jgi:hypothetical protein
MSDLEHLVARACREQPPLQAPPALAARVLQEIERRRALPWWRRSFGHWPLPVRVAFALACALLAASLFTPPLARLALTAAAPFAWLHQAGASAVLLNSVFSHVGGDLAHSLAPHGVYVSLAGICALYLMLAGLFATTYRTLYVAR